MILPYKQKKILQKNLERMTNEVKEKISKTLKKKYENGKKQITDEMMEILNKFFYKLYIICLILRMRNTYWKD
jgi:hypothetical protein